MTLETKTRLRVRVLLVLKENIHNSRRNPCVECSNFNRTFSFDKAHTLVSVKGDKYYEVTCSGVHLGWICSSCKDEIVEGNDVEVVTA